MWNYKEGLLQLHEHWRRVDSRAAARNSTRRSNLERLPPLFTFLPMVRIPVTCKREKKHNKQSVLVLFFSSQIWFLWFCHGLLPESSSPVVDLVVGHCQRWWRLDLDPDLLHGFELEESRERETVDWWSPVYRGGWSVGAERSRSRKNTAGAATVFSLEMKGAAAGLCRVLKVFVWLGFWREKEHLWPGLGEGKWGSGRERSCEGEEKVLWCAFPRPKGGWWWLVSP